MAAPGPALGILDPTECGGGQDDILSGPVVNMVADVTEVTHGGHITLADHLGVVVVGAEVAVLDIDGLGLATADDASRAAVQAAHGGGHCDPAGG